MNEVFDSVYPDLLQAGLSKLGLLDERRELLALFSAIEHFRRDLHGQDAPAGILQVSQRYIGGLNLFHTTGFWLVNPADLSFELQVVAPKKDHATLKAIVDAEIKNGKFAWALRQNSEVFFDAGTLEQPARGVLHALTLSSQVVGM